MSRVYRIDVDNTICKTKGEDYENAKPYKDRIEQVNKLYNAGHTIIYETARGQVSGKNWIDFTRKQLREWGCKFKTVGEKKYADFIIDDKAINSNEFFK
jgi:hypothetical protein